MGKLTLQEYAKLKHGTVKGVAEYALSKGINIPIDPDYVIEDSVLKLIDPALCFKLKYKFSVPQKKQTEYEQSQLTEDAKKISDTSLPESKNEEKTTDKTTDSKKRKTPKRVIGIVKFFDSNKGFGFVVTGCKGISGKPEDSSTIFEFYLNSSEWKSSSTPNNYEWIVFTPARGKKGRNAVNAERLTYNKDGLLIAMAYRGIYAKINGKDSKGDNHNYNVLGHVIDEIILRNQKEFIIEAFAEYLSHWDESRLESIISQFLQDTKLLKRLVRLLPSLENYLSDDESYNKSVKQLIQSVREAIFKSKDIEMLNALPDDFDFSQFEEGVLDVVKESVFNTREEVKKWLHSHLNICECLLKHTVDLPLELVYILFEIKKDYSVFINTGKPWDEVYKFIKEKSLVYARDFFVAYLSNDKNDSVDIKAISNVVEKEQLHGIAVKMLAETSVYADTLGKLAEIFVSNDLDIVKKLISRGIDISHLYNDLACYMSTLVKTNESEVREFMDECKKTSISIVDIFVGAQNISDEMLVELFTQTTDVEYLNEIENFDSIPDWINNQVAEFLLKFLQSCQKVFVNDEDRESIADTLSAIKIELFINAIKPLSDDERYKILQLFPESYAKGIVINHFASTKLFDIYVGELWTKLKSNIPYVSFDLETDGDKIKDFAFRKNGNTRFYQGEEQLGTLLRALAKTEIIVGHRVKQWDLEILSNKGYKSDAFIWDTLEIEILLNPCRYSYALHTTHTAKEDTELADKLFWNQLFRLSQDESLCIELSSLLPSKINEILEELRRPEFVNFFKETSGSEDSFYQILVDTNDNIVEQLKSIEQEASNALIIAPRRLWARIAEHVSLSFAQEQDDIEYMSVSPDYLNRYPLDDVFLNAILKRFFNLTKTPIVSNIAQYIRINYLPDTILAQYVESAKGRLACADLDVITRDEIISDFKEISFIGCEIENRMNQYTLPTKFKPADFWNSASNIPMRLGASSYLAISEEERTSLNVFKDVPVDATNIWIERDRKGVYVINYNYDFYAKIKGVEAKKGDDFTVQTIKWTTQSEDSHQIVLINSKTKGSFDARQKRVSATSRYRATYWAYQFALIKRINLEDHRPKILLLDDELEIEQVEAYAIECGFYIPKEGSQVRRLELIERHANGMMVVSKESFFEITGWRKDTPYCYIWDHLAVEKHRMMWNGFINDKNKTFLNDGISHKGLNIGSIDDTYQATLMSIWPVYEYYYRFIRANSIESTMYILDSFMEEYNILASEWGVSSRSMENLWDNEDQFNNDVECARGFFDDKEIIYQNDADIKTSMDVIFKVMVNPDGNPEMKWHDYQEAILPLILSREENYLISLPTGGGKSVLFQGPALYNSAYTNKLSIVVTPLKALMQDQVKELQEKGFITNVDYLNGDRSYQETKSIYRKINGGEIAVLYVTPERFRSRSFLNALSTRMANDHGLEYMVFDEAHCVSQWGMEFRPEYLNVIKKCKQLKDAYGKDMCIAMFSATVTDMIYNQINDVVPVKRLGQDNDKVIYNPIRSHIGMSFRNVQHEMASRLNEVVEYIKTNKIDPAKSRMLVFCKTRAQCEESSLQLAEMLVKENIVTKETANQSIGYFHAGMDSTDREETYTRFKDSTDPLYILCATKAFGMGMDIPNIHYIIHLTPPSVMEDYLQEVGRAGRNKTMYEEAGFNADFPIPAVCLYSNEDIKKAKDMLLQNSLSWKNLEEIRTEIINYITKIQPLGRTKEYPIVVPNTLWSSSLYDHDFTNFKIGLYWLERMGRIKMGFLCPTHISITILDEDNDRKDISLEEKIQRLNDTKMGRMAMDILTLLRTMQNRQQCNTVQISIQEFSAHLLKHSSKIINCLLWCEKHSILRIEEETRCRIAQTRWSEVDYILNNTQTNVALHIILNATKSILKNNKLNTEKNYSLDEIRSFVKNEADGLQSLVKNVTKKIGDNDEKVQYMIWYNEADKGKNRGLSIAKSYRDDLIKKRVHQVLMLLEMIPHVKVQSYLDARRKSVKQSVIVEKNTWKDFLDSFEYDCLRVLRYVHDSRQEKKRWSEIIIDLGLENKGFDYFNSILRYLKGMAYISTDALLPMGVEVYTTDKSEDVINETIEEESTDYGHKEAFDEAQEIKSLRICVMDVLTTKIKSKQEFQKLITEYFSMTKAEDFNRLLSNYYDESDPVWDSIRATAMKNAEQKMKNNAEQWAIYSMNSNENVNVEAGPGSGKTHLLTMRCANLIYHQHVNPQNILVLAYNRAVVIELKSRLAKLFLSLGLSRSASQLHVHTFHSLAKRICGEKVLEGRDMNEWESILLNTIKSRPNEVRAAMPRLQYVFIDEFQDITQIRLNAMIALNNIYSQLTFFTIGDKDQSIYGFEKAESMDPNYYYEQLYNTLNPKKMTMTTNYRSYPGILQAASLYLPPTSKVPQPCLRNIENEPGHDYVYIKTGRDWSKDFNKIVRWLKVQGVADVAVFFRTNNEVNHGYSMIKALNIPDTRTRIQGASAGEIFRTREIYAVLKLLDYNASKRVKLDGGQSEMALKKKISAWINQTPNWDAFYMDLAFVLILNFLEFCSNDEESHTYGDMAAWIRETLREDNPQLYKLYEDPKFADRRILKGEQMNVVLTTMHKVKGLEFDAVIVTPSVASLPFNPTEVIDQSTPLSSKDRELIEEERRLLYVAYTRAKKYLFAYKGEREKAVEQMKRFESQEDAWGIREQKLGLENYNIGYNAGYNYGKNGYIIRNVKKNDDITIERQTAFNKSGQRFFMYKIKHNNVDVGQLSSKSSIAKRMEKEGINHLDGFFVSDVFYWTYEDTLAADQRALRETGRSTEYASKWNAQAKNKGFIFIVDIAGYGN